MSDLQDLFQTDPLLLTTKDFSDAYEAKTGAKPLATIIKVYREARAQFDLGAKSAGATKKVAKGGDKIKDLGDLLSDL